MEKKNYCQPRCRVVCLPTTDSLLFEISLNDDEGIIQGAPRNPGFLGDGDMDVSEEFDEP